MRIHSIFLHLMRSLSECPHFRVPSKRSNHLTPSLVRLRCSHVLESPRCVRRVKRERPEVMRPEAHSGIWSSLELPLLSWSAQMLRSPGMCDAITDHLCLWAQAATSCTKTCKGQAVVNNLLTPASEAVLSVPVGMQMPRTLCPSQDHAIRMSAS